MADVPTGFSLTPPQGKNSKLLSLESGLWKINGVYEIVHLLHYYSLQVSMGIICTYPISKSS
jgi:hypothetical protein